MKFTEIENTLAVGLNTVKSDDVSIRPAGRIIF